MTPDAILPNLPQVNRQVFSRADAPVQGNHGFSQQEEADTPAAQLQESVQFVDEASASATQFFSKKIFVDQSTQYGPGFEGVLDEKGEMKAQIIEKAFSEQAVDKHSMMAFMQRLLPDDSDLIIVLREILRKKQLDEVARATVKELLEAAEAGTDKKAVYAGINCAIKARLFGKELGLKPAYLRSLYRDFLFLDNPPAEVYLDLISNFGPRKRKLVLDYIESALSSDSKAQDASCSSIEFGQFLNKLNQLRMLQTVERLFVDSVVKNETVRKFNDNETTWLRFLISVLINPEGLESLLEDVVGEKMKTASKSDISVMLVAIYNGCRVLPTLLFPDPEAIEAVLGHFQGLFQRGMKNTPGQKERILC